MVKSTSDHDEFGDACDRCGASDSGDTIVIDNCDTGVANNMVDGCTRTDDVTDCAEAARNHGDFVQCVAHLANSWVRSGSITKADHKRLFRCAAHADITHRGGK